MRTRQVRASAWRTAFVTASTAIRYAATSTAAGSSGSGDGAPATEIRTVASPGPPSSRRACWSIAATSPTSSIAGGRSPSTSRRTSASATPDLGRQLLEQRPGRGRVVVQRRGGRLGPHADSRQRRAQPVVEVATQPAPLLLAREHEPLPRPDEVVPQPDRAHGRARLPPEVLEQRELVVVEALLAAAHAEHQPPDGLRAAHERDGRLRGGRRAGHRGRPQLARLVGHLEGHVRQPERVRDGLDDRRKRAIGLRRPLESLPQAPHGPPGLVARRRTAAG